MLKRSKSKTEIHSQQQSQEHTGQHQHQQQQAYYFGLKTIQFKDRIVPIVLQNKNGPCPLLAVVNILTLRGYPIIYDKPYISPSYLLDHVRNYIVQQPNTETNEEMRRNYEITREEAIANLPNSLSGLFVNVKFRGITSFEFTKEMALFDFCKIRIVHGWLPDPQDSEMFHFLHNLSYNQLIEKQLLLEDRLNNEQAPITTKRPQSMSPSSYTKWRSDQDSLDSITHEGFLAERFLNESASQISYHGLSCLLSGTYDEELCVLFRNNHFSTLYKHQGLLLDLVTDLGYSSSSVVWENFCDIDGNTTFLRSDFTLYQPSSFPMLLPSSEQDKALAIRLQEEENKRGNKRVLRKHNKVVMPSSLEKKHHLFRRHKNKKNEDTSANNQQTTSDISSSIMVANHSVENNNHLSDEKCSIQ